MIIKIPQVSGTYELFDKILNLIIGDSNRGSLIDLCCCHATCTHKLKFKTKKYIDIKERKLDGDQDNFIQADVLGNHPIFEQHYDICTCLDGIEHVTKEQGWFLLDRMKKIADKAIIFTPADAWMMEEIGSDKYINEPDSHKSLWNPKELDGWASIVYPHYHESLKIGAFFSWYCKDVNNDFERVNKEL